MEIKDNIIKKKLENVYFIAGTNCGGKSSMAKALSEKHDMYFYSADSEYWNHRKISDEVSQPNMNRPFLGWEDYFMRDAKKQAEWLIKAEKEEMDFIIVDLLEIASQTDKKIVVDIHRDVDLFKRISDYHRVIFLLAENDLIQKEYFGREDKNDMLVCIKRETKDPDEAINNVLKVAEIIGTIERNQALESGFFTHTRHENTDFLKRIEIVEKHFKLI
ncbi:AAA family ATPase [Liberiplasma polymorphum]|uniref:AAA family ATPase n=1 Tax=Liberiplasma polymorphum TaxID=3374570 RepID=UPI003775BE8B